MYSYKHGTTDLLYRRTIGLGRAPIDDSDHERVQVVFADALLILCLVWAGSQKTALRAPDNVAPYYTVQIQSVPSAKRDRLLATYESLKAKGHLAYCRDACVNGRAFIRLRVGLFRNHTTAQTYGQAMHECDGFDYFVTRADLPVETFGDAFEIVTTPNDIWFRSDASLRPLYHFDTSEAAATCSGAKIDPKGRAIAFACDNQIVRIDLRDGSAIVLKQGQREDALFNSVLAWSPDGQRIAYLDTVGWEQPTKLWAMQSDGRRDRCLVADETQQTRVKSFRWHPSGNELFYVSGPAHGTVSVGGSLCRVDLQGNHRVVVPACESRRTEVYSEFHVAGDEIRYQLAHFDTDYQVRYYTPHAVLVDR